VRQKWSFTCCFPQGCVRGRTPQLQRLLFHPFIATCSIASPVPDHLKCWRVLRRVSSSFSSLLRVSRRSQTPAFPPAPTLLPPAANPSRHLRSTWRPPAKFVPISPLAISASVGFSIPALTRTSDWNSNTDVIYSSLRSPRRSNRWLGMPQRVSAYPADRDWRFCRCYALSQPR
jgi:hypothetical protein